MLVHSGITAGSYNKAISTNVYPSAILHLKRPMTKLCLSDLFSISLAEFYSSDKLKLKFSLILLSKSNLIFSVLSSNNWNLLFDSVSRTAPLAIETKACTIVKKSTMAEIIKNVNHQLILLAVAVAVAAPSHYFPVTRPQCPCPRLQMVDMDG